MAAIDWDAVNGANEYVVRVIRNDHTSTYPITHGQFNFLYAFEEVGEYKVSVQSRAIAGGETYHSAFSQPVTVTRLPAPTQRSPGSGDSFITSDANSSNGQFTVHFHAVAGASYRLYEDNLSTQTTSTTNQLTHSVSSNPSFTLGYNTSFGVRSVGRFVAHNNVFLSSIETLNFDITVLPAPTQLNIEDYLLTWQGPNSPFNVLVGTQVSTTLQNVRQRDLNDIVVAGEWPVRVSSRGNGAQVLTSSVSNTITVHRLAAPTHLTISHTYSQGILNFESTRLAVPVQTSFTVYIGGSSRPSLEDTNELPNLLNYIELVGTSVAVRVNANMFESDGANRGTYYMTSHFSTNITVFRLAPVTFPIAGSARFTNSHLNWNAPSNVGTHNPNYDVFSSADGAVRALGVSDRRFDITGLGAGEHIFYVIARGDGFFLSSEISNPVSITRLVTPTVSINTTLSAYEWNGVTGATAYQVRIGSNVHTVPHTGLGVHRFELLPSHFAGPPGAFDVQVIAIGNDGVTTIDSHPRAFQQTTRRLTAPTFTFAYSHTQADPEGRIDITITNPSRMQGLPDQEGTPTTRGYFFASTGLTTHANPITLLTHSIAIGAGEGPRGLTVTAAGGEFNGNTLGTSVFYLPNQQQGTIPPLTILGSVTQSTIVLQEGVIVSWVGVGLTNSYSVTVAVTGGASQTTTVTGTSLDLRTLGLSATGTQNTTITIRALGNGIDLISGVTTQRQMAINWNNIT
jgi:hypothetical protein